MTINVSSRKLFQLVQFIVLLAILGLLLWSQPWSTETFSSNKKTITVTGETTLEATPDEFTFYPYFQKEGTDKDALRDELVTEANTLVNGLKELGVPEENITLDASSY